MKQLHHNFLLRTNMIIGALLAMLGFVGCHTSKNAAKNTPKGDDVITEQPVNDGRVMCLYGVPPEVYADTIKTDTIKEEPRPQPIMVKYGAPMPLVKYGVPPSFNR